MDSTLAALIGAVIGGGLSVLASWLAQRVQTRSQWLTQEVRRRQDLYSEFVEAAACCFGDALLENEPDTARIANLYGEMGRMRLVSSEPVLKEANRIVHKILDTYNDTNRSRTEVRDFLAHDSVDLFSDFGNACRAELIGLQPLRIGIEGPSMFRITPMSSERASA
jgi:hypothetical protein